MNHHLEARHKTVRLRMKRLDIYIYSDVDTENSVAEKNLTIARPIRFIEILE